MVDYLAYLDYLRPMSERESSKLPEQRVLTRKALLDEEAACAEERASIVRDREVLDERESRVAERERRISLFADYLDSGQFDLPSKTAPPARDVALPSSASGSGRQRKRDDKLTQRILIKICLSVAEGGVAVTSIVGWLADLERMAQAGLQKPIDKTSVSPQLRKMADPRRGMMEVEHQPELHRWRLTDKGRASAEAFKDHWLAAGRSPFWNDAPLPRGAAS